MFRPKSESVNVHSPAVPADTISLAPEADPLETIYQTHEGESTKAENASGTSNEAVEAAARDAELDLKKSMAHLQESLPPGHFQLDQPARLDTLDSLWRLSPGPIEGYRVQVFLGELQAARMERSTLRRITDKPIYLQAMPPSYGLMVGDFRDKWAAERLRTSWARIYPDALTVPCAIEPVQLPARTLSSE
jgi:hypothetical protein